MVTVSRGRILPSYRLIVGVCGSTDRKIGRRSCAARRASSRPIRLSPSSPPRDTAGVNCGGAVEVAAELADLVFGLIEEPGRRAVGGEFSKGPRGSIAGNENAPIDVG